MVIRSQSSLECAMKLLATAVASISRGARLVVPGPWRWSRQASVMVRHRQLHDRDGLDFILGWCHFSNTSATDVTTLVSQQYCKSMVSTANLGAQSSFVPSENMYSMYQKSFAPVLYLAGQLKLHLASEARLLRMKLLPLCYFFTLEDSNVA